MRVLVYGAGVIGCYLTHVLCQAGECCNSAGPGRAEKPDFPMPNWDGGAMPGWETLHWIYDNKK